MVMKIEELEDLEKLVEEAKNGDKDAFNKLLDYVKGDLYNTARKMLSNEDDVQDVIQETMLVAYMKIHQLKSSRGLKSWIRTILRNQCKNFYKTHYKKEALIEKYSKDADTVNYIDDSSIDFNNMIESLGDKEKDIFRLYYEDGLTSKEIAIKLHMNENTIKTILSRGKVKLRRTLKPATLLMVILAIFITTGVIATCIISYVKGLFRVHDTSMENDGVLMAIERLDWYQKPEMDYIDMGDGYRFKVDYLLMDEMCLYLVVDLESEKDISKFDNVFMNDLKIVNGNNDIICDESDPLADQFSKKLRTNLIENSNHHIKFLMYMYADSFPICKSLNISFSDIVLSNKSIFNKNKCLNINTNINFTINLAEKFINRHSTSYVANDNIIEKAIVTETGFYAILNATDLKGIDAIIIDESGNSYKCYYDPITDNNFIPKYVLIANFNDVSCKNLKLMINNNEYKLNKN